MSELIEKGRLYFNKSVKRRLCHRPGHQKALSGGAEHDLNPTRLRQIRECADRKASETDLHKLFVVYLNPPVSVSIVTLTSVSKNSTTVG